MPVQFPVCTRASIVAAHRFVVATLVLAAVAVLPSCGGSTKDSVTAPVIVAQGFSVALSPASTTVNAGSNTSLTATIARTGSFSGTVNLSVENMPAGITATLSPAAISSSISSTTLSVAAASSVAPGNYTITVRGAATGITDQTATIAVTVLPTPAFALTVTPTSLTVQAGSNGRVVAQIARTNFTAAVTLAIEGAPSGVTVQVATPSLAADTTSLNVTVTGAATPGTYSLLVRAQSTLSDRSVPLTLTVTAAPDFTLTAGAPTVTVTQGQTSATVTLNIARSGGFAGAVALSATGLPLGVTANFASSSVTASSTTLTLSAATTATVGTNNIVIHGNATGLSERTATVALTVTASPGGFALTLSAATISVPQASSSSVTISVTRTPPFTGAVTLTLSGAATGATASLSSATIAAGATTATITVSATILAPINAPAPFVVHATAAGVPSQDATVMIGVVSSTTAIVAEHILVQQGLGLALSFSVLQVQLLVIQQATTHGLGSAKPCTTMVGGGSVQSLPVGADNPTMSGIYYDNACTKPYIVNNITSYSEAANHQVELAGTANYFSLTGTSLGVLTMQQSAQVSTGVENFVAGTGTFAPATGATSIRMGLVCTLQAAGQTAIPCSGGIVQNVPSLGIAVGSVTPISLHVTAVDAPMTFDGNSAVLMTGAPNALSLAALGHSSLNIAGGTVWGTSTQQGGTGTFSLFPALPAGWTIADTAHDMKFSIDFTSNETSTGTVKQLSTGVVLATVVVNGSGTGTVTWSDGAVATVTGWALAN